MEIKKGSKHIHKLIQERGSIRKFNPTVKISRDEISNILQDAMTAPSSLNLQPWRFVVIDTEEGKKLIEPYMMFNRKQWETSSAIIAVFADLQCISKADEIYNAAVENNLMTLEEKEKRVWMIKNYTSSYTTEKIKNSVMLDCGFVIMQIMIAAKSYGYDTSPIGGYQKKELLKALDMDTERYLSILLLPIGKADEKVKNTIRYSVSDVTSWK